MLRRAADRLPKASPVWMFIGVTLVVWLAISSPRKRTLIVWAIDLLMGSQSLAQNVISIRREEASEAVETSMDEATAWWTAFRDPIVSMAAKLAERIDRR